MNKKSWPLGLVPEKFQRSELKQLKSLGYNWKDARDVIDIFEKKVAAFAGSKYAISLDCCSHGIFLALKWYKDKKNSKEQIITIPKRTYVSVPMQIINAGFLVRFHDIAWEGIYQLNPFDIFDGAVRWTRNMYKGGLHIVSFHYKKRIPIGKGGMILTDDEDAMLWLKKVRYDSRNMDMPVVDQDIDEIGYHFYMTPEDAARGIILMDSISELNIDSACSSDYNDLSQLTVFKNNDKVISLP